MCLSAWLTHLCIPETTIVQKPHLYLRLYFVEPVQLHRQYTAHLCLPRQYTVSPAVQPICVWEVTSAQNLHLDLCVCGISAVTICVWTPTDRAVSAELVQVRILPHNTGASNDHNNRSSAGASVSPTASICGFCTKPKPTTARSRNEKPHHTLMKNIKVHKKNKAWDTSGSCKQKKSQDLLSSQPLTNS